MWGSHGVIDGCLGGDEIHGVFCDAFLFVRGFVVISRVRRYCGIRSLRIYSGLYPPPPSVSAVSVGRKYIVDLL